MKRNLAEAIAYADMMADRCLAKADQPTQISQRERLLAKARLWWVQSQEMAYGK